MSSNFHINFRRILEPIILGSVSNVVVNFIFHHDSPEMRIDEFIIACILSTPVTELNRYIDKQLERRINWIEYPKKRFATHLVLISLCLLISLNVLGYTYLLITKKGFFSWKETCIINMVCLSISILLTFFNWAVHFYFRWIGAENIASENARLVNDLKQKIIQPTRVIEIHRGTSRIKIEPRDIHIAKIDFGIVRIYCNNGESGFFQGNLTQLKTLLPDYLFFQVSRDAIIHREVIRSISSSTFGKIQLMVNERNNNSSIYTVSRPKAAAFRKWYNSNSALNK